MAQHLIERDLQRFAVKINDLLVPGRAVETLLSKYCTSLGVLADDEDYPIYMPGSATLIKYRERYFMVCTKHQLSGTTDLEKVGLLLPFGNGQTKVVTSGGARWFEQVSDGDHQQVVLFDFTVPCHDLPELKPLFFDFRGQHPTIPSDQVVGLLVYGFPTEGTIVEYEKGKVHQSKRIVFCNLTAPGSDNALHILDILEPLDFDPDGMSGGPAFAVVIDPHGNFSAHLAGVTVRGSREKLMIIKAGAIQAMMNASSQK